MKQAEESIYGGYKDVPERIRKDLAQPDFRMHRLDERSGNAAAADCGFPQRLWRLQKEK